MAVTYHWGIVLVTLDSYIINLKLLWSLTEKSSLARFRIFFPSDLLLIWQICSAMSANDLINFCDKQFQNGRLVAILNFNNFVIFT